MTPKEKQLLELAHKIIINSMHGSAHPTGIRVWKENMAEYTRLRAELEKDEPAPKMPTECDHAGAKWEYVKFCRKCNTSLNIVSENKRKIK